MGDQVQQAKRDPSMLVRAHLRTRDDIDCFFEWPSLEGAELNIRHLLQRGYQPAVPPSGEYAARLALLEQQMAALHERLERLLEAAQVMLEHMQTVERLLAVLLLPAPVEALPAGHYARWSNLTCRSKSSPGWQRI